jgi:hypothetical protein
MQPSYLLSGPKSEKGEPFKGRDVSLNSLSDLISKLAVSPGLQVRSSIGVSSGG